MSDDAEWNYDIRYWIDHADAIVDIDAGWEDFARQNDAPELEPRRVIGRNLLGFVHGDVTRMFVRTLMQSARLQRKPIVRAYRCDSPQARRYMEMRLSLETSGLLCWEHRLIRSEPLARPLRFRVATPGSSAKSAVVRCSMCNRLKTDGVWQEADCRSMAVDTGEITQVIYGVCPDCLARPAARNLRKVGV